MIDELTISNIGGLSSATLRISGQFVAITGESGAGKSSVVRAIELISGKRAQTSLIRHGEEHGFARAMLLFQKKTDLPEGIFPEENTLFVSRSIFRNGKGRTTIQDQPVPLSTLSSLMDNQIRIQSQFAQLDLLSTNKQLEIIDSCGGKELIDILSDLKQTFQQALRLDREIRELKQNQSRIIEQYKDAESIIQDFRKIDPFPGCDKIWDQALIELQEHISSANKLKETLLRLTGTDMEEGIMDAFYALLSNLCNYSNKEDQSEWNALLSLSMEKSGRLVALAEEKNRPLTLDEMEISYEETEKKTGILKKIMRRARVSDIEELIEFCKKADKELIWLTESYQIIESKEQESIKLRKDASKKAMNLRKLRNTAAKELKTRVNWVMGELAMMGLVFDVEVKELGKLRVNGADEVSFILRTPEGAFGPVNKISSGGELSRMLLSIQVSLPDEQLPKTVVFDEVEAGLGGKAAVLAGYKLKQLSEKCQVILITHEASIASIADQHFVIRKHDMESSLEEITGEQRVKEIARMLSGDYNLYEAREHARKLLKTASADIPATINLL